MKTLNKVEQFLIKCFTVFTGVLLILTISFVVLAVLDRTLLKIGFFWTEEMARTCYIWFSMCAPAIMVTAGTQFACTYFMEKLLPNRAHQVLNIVINLVVLVVLVCLSVYGFEYVQAMSRQKMPTVNAPIAMMYLSLPIGMGLMGIMTVFHLIHQIYGFLHPEELKNESGEGSKFDPASGPLF